MIVVGLTGGMGMGKSTAAGVFRRARIPVFDADATVHRLQAPGGRAVKAIASAFPTCVRDECVDRPCLRRAILRHPEALQTLERILHPMVRDAERAFLARARRGGHQAAVLDIPLLMETDGTRRVDRIVVVSAPPSVQRERVRRRRQMTAAEASAVIGRQLPDAEKRRRADVVIRTGLSRHHALRDLTRFIQDLRNAPRRIV